MLKIVLTLDVTLIICHICGMIKQYIISKSKVEVARLMCNYTELSENDIENICRMLNN